MTAAGTAGSFHDRGSGIGVLRLLFSGASRSRGKPLPNTESRPLILKSKAFARTGAFSAWEFLRFPIAHPRRYGCFMVLSTILGGGMSSRLFQNVREKHGLAYFRFVH